MTFPLVIASSEFRKSLSDRQVFLYRMPTISIYEDDVKAELGDILLNYGSKQGLVKSFDELCFNFGLELDEVTSEYEMFKKERGMSNFTW